MHLNGGTKVAIKANCRQLKGLQAQCHQELTKKNTQKEKISNGCFRAASSSLLCFITSAVAPDLANYRHQGPLSVSSYSYRASINKQSQQPTDFWIQLHKPLLSDNFFQYKGRTRGMPIKKNNTLLHLIVTISIFCSYATRNRCPTSVEGALSNPSPYCRTCIVGNYLHHWREVAIASFEYFECAGRVKGVTCFHVDSHRAHTFMYMTQVLSIGILLKTAFLRLSLSGEGLT